MEMACLASMSMVGHTTSVCVDRIQMVHLHAGHHARTQAPEQNDGRGPLCRTEEHDCKQRPENCRQAQRPRRLQAAGPAPPSPPSRRRAAA